MSLKRDTFWTAADTFAAAGLAFAFRLMLAKVLAPEQFGIAALALSTVALIQVFAEFGLTAALIQKEAGKFSQKLLDSTFTASAILATVLCLLTALVAAPLSAKNYNAPELETLVRVLAVGLLCAPISTISSALLYRARRFRDLAVIRTLGTLGSLALAGAWLLFRAGAEVVVVQAIAAQIFFAAGLYIATRWRIRLHFDRHEIFELFRFSGFVLANDLFVAFAGNLGVLIVGRTLGTANAGLFSLAVYMTDTVRKSLMSILNRVMFVHYSRIRADLPQIREAFIKTLSLNCRIVFPTMTAFALFAPPFLIHFLGAEWAGMRAVIVWLCISVMIHAAGGTTSTLYKGLGRPGLDLVIFAGTTLLLLAPGVALGAHLAGLTGAALATAVTKAISILIRQIALDRLVGSTAGRVSAVVGRCLLAQTPIIACWLLAILVDGGLWISGLLLAVGFCITGALTIGAEVRMVASRIMPSLR